MAAQHTISQKVLHCADRASFRATKRGLSAGRSDRREGAGEDDVCAAPVATDGSSRNIGGALAVVGDGAWSRPTRVGLATRNSRSRIESLGAACAAETRFARTTKGAP